MVVRLRMAASQWVFHLVCTEPSNQQSHEVCWRRYTGSNNLPDRKPIQHPMISFSVLPRVEISCIPIFDYGMIILFKLQLIHVITPSKIERMYLLCHYFLKEYKTQENYECKVVGSTTDLNVNFRSRIQDV